MDGIIANLLPFLALLAGFGFLIFVHELGHFLVAKWVGVRCTQFAIGFGHSVMTYRKGIGFRPGTTEPEYDRRARRMLRDEGVDLDSLSESQQQLRLFEAGDRLGMGETEYRLNWMPLGGYVKMLGQEDMDPTARSDDPRAFNRKPVWARAAVISAGVTMNLIFGLIFFVIAFMAGVKFPPAVIGETAPGSPAATTYATGHADDPTYLGLRPGDRVLSIDEEAVTDFMDIAVNTALASPDQTISLAIERDGQTQPLIYDIKPVAASQGGGKLLSIGVAPALSLVIGGEQWEVNLDPNLAAAGVKPGDRVTHVDDVAVQRYDQFAAAVESREGEPAKVTFVNDRTAAVRHVELSAEPLLTGGRDVPLNLMGFQPMLGVRAVMPKSPAEAIGLKPGDTIIEIDGLMWPGYTEALTHIGKSAGKTLAIQVLRDGEVVDLGRVRVRRNEGIGFYTRVSFLLGLALPQSPAAALELNPGSRLTAINGKPVDDWGDLQRELAAIARAHREGGTATVAFVRNVTDQPQGTAEIRFSDVDAETLAAARWRQPVVAFEPLKVPITASTPWAATTMGFHKTKQFMLQTYVTLLRLFQRTVPVEELRGPVGIFHIGTQTAQQGWTYLLFFLGLISVNLVVINFLPIPIVDGGLMVFLIIEKIKGSPVHPTVLAAANWVGLALIGTIMLVTLYHDISRLLPQ